MYSAYFETGSKKGRRWRDHLQVHPAAELFPLMSETDPAALKELAEDIRQHGQREPASYVKDSGGNRVLLDGRNRLDALEMLGRKIDINDSSMFEQRSLSINAQAFIISKNIHRRHLTPEKKRDLIGLLLKANPEKSDRSIAKLAKTSPTTVGAVRSTVKSGQLEKRIGADGKARKQPARLKNTDPDCPDCGGNGYFRGGDSGRCHCHGSRPKKSTSPDNSSSGVSQVSTTPEKLTSGLPAGSDSPKTPTEQATVVEPQTQPNPIIAAWLAGTRAQRDEFIRDHGDAIADSLATAKAREKDAPPRYRIWNNCVMIELYLDENKDRLDWAEQYQELADDLSNLEQTIDDELAEDEEEEDEDEDGADPDDDLAIPDYLKRAAT